MGHHARGAQAHGLLWVRKGDEAVRTAAKDELERKRFAWFAWDKAVQ